MKKILLALILIGICGVSVAQRKFKISPSYTLSGTAEFGMYTNFKIYQDNISNDTIVLKWKLIYDNLIKGWDYSSCAFGICYAYIPDTLCTMSAIPPGESGFLSLTIDPLNIKGTGKASIFLYERNSPTIIDTITFIINAEPLNGIADYKYDNSLEIYPNPATEFIYIKNNRPDVNVASIQIKDLLGKEVYNCNANALSIINISHLSKGLYFVNYNYEDSTQAIKKFQINK